MSPPSVLLIHGAGSSAAIYDDWPDAFPNLYVVAVDLHENIDVGRASMDDYAERVVVTARSMPHPVALCGWSMGGLVALQAAGRARAHSVILLDSSTPGEVQGFDFGIPLATGTFDPEVAYGSFPPGVEARPESTRARSERKRGVSVPELLCPSLVIYGDDFRDERGGAIARLYGSEERYFPGDDHWALLSDPRVREAIANFLGVRAGSVGPGSDA
jgi:pimeloyl-ACP methyl ester carboxylesterase